MLFGFIIGSGALLDAIVVTMFMVRCYYRQHCRPRWIASGVYRDFHGVVALTGTALWTVLSLSLDPKNFSDLLIGGGYLANAVALGFGMYFIWSPGPRSAYAYGS